MASVRRETAEEVAFRKTKEAVTSTLSTALNAVLPEGTDYHVRGLSILSDAALPACTYLLFGAKLRVFLQYYKTFGEFRSNMEELQRRVKGLLLKFPVNCSLHLSPIAYASERH